MSGFTRWFYNRSSRASNSLLHISILGLDKIHIKIVIFIRYPFV